MAASLRDWWRCFPATLGGPGCGPPLSLVTETQTWGSVQDSDNTLWWTPQQWWVGRLNDMASCGWVHNESSQRWRATRAFYQEGRPHKVETWMWEMGGGCQRGVILSAQPPSQLTYLCSAYMTVQLLCVFTSLVSPHLEPPPRLHACDYVPVV